MQNGALEHGRARRRTGREPNPKNTVKHRIATYINMSLAPISSAQGKVLTSKSFQIRCKGAANEKDEGKKLLGDKGRIEHSRASHALASKRAQATLEPGIGLLADIF
jgi:hypothetical protein